jgi:hypothetical protein
VLDDGCASVPAGAWPVLCFGDLNLWGGFLLIPAHSRCSALHVLLQVTVLQCLVLHLLCCYISAGQPLLLPGACAHQRGVCREPEHGGGLPQSACLSQPGPHMSSCQRSHAVAGWSAHMPAFGLLLLPTSAHCMQRDSCAVPGCLAAHQEPCCTSRAPTTVSRVCCDSC